MITSFIPEGASWMARFIPICDFLSFSGQRTFVLLMVSSWFPRLDGKLRAKVLKIGVRDGYKDAISSVVIEPPPTLASANSTLIHLNSIYTLLHFTRPIEHTLLQYVFIHYFIFRRELACLYPGCHRRLQFFF
jgi:hypothetical protein